MARKGIAKELRRLLRVGNNAVKPYVIPTISNPKDVRLTSRSQGTERGQGSRQAWIDENWIDAGPGASMTSTKEGSVKTEAQDIAEQNESLRHFTSSLKMRAEKRQSNQSIVNGENISDSRLNNQYDIHQTQDPIKERVDDMEGYYDAPESMHISGHDNGADAIYDEPEGGVSVSEPWELGFADRVKAFERNLNGRGSKTISLAHEEEGHNLDDQGDSLARQGSIASNPDSSADQDGVSLGRQNSITSSAGSFIGGQDDVSLTHQDSVSEIPASSADQDGERSSIATIGRNAQDPLPPLPEQRRLTQDPNASESPSLRRAMDTEKDLRSINATLRRRSGALRRGFSGLRKLITRAFRSLVGRGRKSADISLEVNSAYEVPAAFTGRDSYDSYEGHIYEEIDDVIGGVDNGAEIKTEGIYDEPESVEVTRALDDMETASIDSDDIYGNLDSDGDILESPDLDEEELHEAKAMPANDDIYSNLGQDEGPLENPDLDGEEIGGDGAEYRSDDIYSQTEYTQRSPAEPESQNNDVTSLRTNGAFEARKEAFEKRHPSSNNSKEAELKESKKVKGSKEGKDKDRRGSKADAKSKAEPRSKGPRKTRAQILREEHIREKYSKEKEDSPSVKPSKTKASLVTGSPRTDGTKPR